jgi:hypothetical protein
MSAIIFCTLYVPYTCKLSRVSSHIHPSETSVGPELLGPAATQRFLPQPTALCDTRTAARSSTMIGSDMQCIFCSPCMRVLPSCQCQTAAASSFWTSGSEFGVSNSSRAVIYVPDMDSAQVLNKLCSMIKPNLCQLQHRRT